jgi:hypothetical protein
MTKTAPTGAGLATIVLPAATWIVAFREMKGMDMGVATELGSFTSFVGNWCR